MSTSLQDRGQSELKLAQWVDRHEVRARISAAVGDIMDADQFIAHALVAFQDPKVKSCTPLSQYTALHQLAALGLLPTLGQVVLIPYKDQIKCMPQWQGFKALMERHPSVLEVTAVIVHKNDTFRFHNGEVLHDYDPFDATRNIQSLDNIKGGYCKIIYRDGRPPKYHIVTVEHIDKCRRCAQTQEVWGKWLVSMILKTLYRDCFARRAVPMDPLVHARLQAVVHADDINHGNNPNRIGEEFSASGHEPPAVPKSRTEQLADFLSSRSTAAETKPAPSETRPREPGCDTDGGVTMDDLAMPAMPQESGPHTPTYLDTLRDALDGVDDPEAVRTFRQGVYDDAAIDGDTRSRGLQLCDDRIEAISKPKRTAARGQNGLFP